MYNTKNNEVKIDRRKKYILMVDTETCNGIMVNNKLNLDNSLVYDLGLAVTDKQGTIYETKSLVIADIFFGLQDIMKSAYYNNKIPNYYEDIIQGTREVVTFNKARNIILYLMNKYKIDTVCMHNARFDVNALNVTYRYITSSAKRYFFPYGTVVWDTLKMANDIYKDRPSYRAFCEKYGYFTKHKTPRPRLTAEILYRFISGNNDFVENHTGLEDVFIEVEILKNCLKQHKKMRKCLWSE